jgi:hypothetical protein
MSTFEQVVLGPAVWPGAAGAVQPGDLTRYTPQGLGLGAPMVLRPWDDLSDIERRGDYYGLQPRAFDPIMDGPRADAAGGVVYLDNGVERRDFDTLLRLLHIGPGGTEFAAFIAESASPVDDNYLVQLRIVSRFALAGLFGVPTEGDADRFVRQPLTIPDALWSFVEAQQERWGSGYSPALSGAMGGDGDWARETLAFGLMVENSYQGVYRIWSRAWLVTK